MLLVGVDGVDVLAAADVGVLGVDGEDFLAAGGGVLGLDGEVVRGEEILSSGQLAAGSVKSLVILFPAMLWVSNVDLRSSTTLALK